MATSYLYLSALSDEASGNINYSQDTIYAMLVSGYTPNTDTHSKRSDVVAFEASGAGYIAGGQASAVTIQPNNTTANSVNIDFGQVIWNNVTLTNVNGIVYYKYRGGVAGNDELIACVIYDNLKSGTNITFVQPVSTITKVNLNP